MASWQIGSLNIITKINAVFALKLDNNVLKLNASIVCLFFSNVTASKLNPVKQWKGFPLSKQVSSHSLQDRRLLIFQKKTIVVTFVL